VTYRVIQWATGSVGRTCLRAVLDSPRCELVGLYVYSEKKAGRDAGEIARRDEVGVRATRDIDEILAIDADVVIHTPRLQVPYELFDDEICRLLRSGKNVITTAGNHYPKAHGSPRHDLFTQAGIDGGTSLFGVGVSPGVIGERIALTLASTSMDLDTISISEVFDASGMVSPDFVFTVMGMGTDPAQTNLLDGPLPGLYRTLYAETLTFMADHLGLTDYVIEADHHFEVTPADLPVRAGLIRAGTVAATEWRWHLSAQGRRRLSLAIIWTMDGTLPRYAGRPHWQITMTGRPELTMSIDMHDPTDPNVRTTASQYIAAGIVMQSIPVVAAAAPGIVEPVTFAPYQFS
jgi:2,4-diaminopentanoate dehydrogenase